MKTGSKSRFHIFTLFVLLAALIGSAVFVMPAYAAGIVVNTATDEDTANANCSLREAIIAANTDAAYNGCSAGSGADTITFAPLVDHILFVVQAGRSSLEDVRKALQMLPKEKILGLVLNRQPDADASKYYY